MVETQISVNYSPLSKLTINKGTRNNNQISTQYKLFKNDA